MTTPILCRDRFACASRIHCKGTGAVQGGALAVERQTIATAAGILLYTGRRMPMKIALLAAMVASSAFAQKEALLFHASFDKGLDADVAKGDRRSEEHTSELQSQSNLVCRLLLEKKKTAAQGVEA